MFNLGNRAIQIFNGSYYINIPKSWAKNNEIKKKDILEFFMADTGELIVKKKKTRSNLNG